MRVKKFALAVLIASVPATAALAQSSPSPSNQSGPGVSPTTPAPTDPSAGSESGNTRGIPERGTMSAPTAPQTGTTGSGSAVPPDNLDRGNTSVPGQGVNKDDVTPPSR